jgi:cytochrome c-type biogenesis protein CcsB
VRLHVKTPTSEARYAFPFEANAWRNDFKETVQVDGHALALHVAQVTINKEGLQTAAKATFALSYKDHASTLTLQQTRLGQGETSVVSLGEVKVTLSYDAKVHTLPFAVTLEQFNTVHYPGGYAPATYFSDVSIRGSGYTIGMNAPLRLGGYTFYQSSYEGDNSILWVNRDPGKWPTYVGYGLLFLGLILNFFDPSSRVRRLMKKVKGMEATLAVVLLFAANGLHANDYEAQYFKDHAAHSKELARQFGELSVQTRAGRMKPLDTLNREILRKLTGRETYRGLDANQAILGMLTHQRLWKRVPLILVKSPKLKEVIGIGKEQRLAKFEDFFRGTTYKLERYVHEAQQLPPARRGTFEKDLIRVDERLNVVLMTYYGALFKIFPNPENADAPWESFDALFKTQEHPEAKIMQTQVMQFMDAAFARDYVRAQKSLKAFAAYAATHGEALVVPPAKLKAEIALNASRVFPRLIGVYMFLGLVCLGLGLIQVFSRPMPKWTHYVLFGLLWVSFAVHTAGIMTRWYVAGYIPMSNTYESIIYIAWSCLLAGLVLFRRSLFGLSASVLLAGIFMLVAHMGNIDPEITPLVPVLASFWLSLHVSIITASYGFLGVGALLGLMTLSLFVLARVAPVKQRQITYLVSVNEIALFIGLTLLVIGNFLGGIWANESWGRYWGWDPKETWTFIAILFYTLVLHWRFLPTLYSALSFSLLSVLSFGSILMTYFGVNFYLAGLHSYAKGDPVPIPVWVYGALGVLGVITLLAVKFQSYVTKEEKQ